MFIGWLTCIPAVLLPHSPCRFTTANAPANRQMPIASVVRRYGKKWKSDRVVARKSLTNWPLPWHLHTNLKQLRLCSFHHLICGQFLADFLGRKTELQIIISTMTPNDWKLWNYDFANDTFSTLTEKKTNFSPRFDSFAHLRAEIAFRKQEKKETLYQLEIRRNPFRVDEKWLQKNFFDLFLLVSTNISHFVSDEKKEKTTFNRENSLWNSNIYQFDYFATRKKTKSISRL